MSIVTKTGDKGETSLMYGRRVPKSDARVDAYGCIDELTAALGLGRSVSRDQLISKEILAVQKDLIVIMGHLIPAGTGFPEHREIKLVEKGEPIGAPVMEEAEPQPAIG